MKSKQKSNHAAPAAIQKGPEKDRKKNIPENVSLLQFMLSDPSNKKYWITAVCISILYLVILKILFPSPSFYSDSYTYIQAAKDNVVISFRPVEYSAFLRFLHNFSTSDFIVVAAQYLLNILANLFLFFTCTCLFPLNPKLKWVLFAILIGNPLYLFYSNYILSDALFCSITVIWITILMLIIRKPGWKNITIQMILLIFLFKLRYNAIIFPVFTTIALLLSRQAFWKKIAEAALSFILVLLLVKNISDKTEQLTTVHVFSAFSGWQLANNAIHVLKHADMDTTDSEEDDKEIYRYIRTYLDTSRYEKSTPENIDGNYLWNKQSPLKQYLPHYKQKNFYLNYFQAWTALGPVYSEFGTEVILQHPFTYIRYFVLPNTRSYFFPDLEAYGTYNENRDTVAKVANVVKTSHSGIYHLIMTPWKFIFPALNCLFLLITSCYFFSGIYKKSNQLFNLSLLLYTVFYFTNFIFVSTLAPNVFRYHVFIITLSIPYCIYLLQYNLSINNGLNQLTTDNYYLKKK
jgi:hypothetical protein